MDKEKLKEICDMAITNLKNDKGLMPTLLVDGLKGSSVMGLEFLNGEQKRAAMEVAGYKCADLIPIAVTFIAEGWMSCTVPMDGKRVSEMPDRQECVTVIHEQSSVESVIECCVVPFTRMGDDILLGETIEMSESMRAESNLLMYFWHGVARGFRDFLEKHPETSNPNN